MAETKSPKKRKSIQTIRDPRLDPYFITKDEYSYTIKQTVTSDATHFRSKGKSKTYEKSLYYVSSMGHALKKIAELHTTEKNYNNLKDFIDDYKNISDTIKSYTDEYNKIHKQLIYKKQ
jgi:Tfp pilus assembly protein PilF